jgi:hypothetical protein
MHGLLVGTFRTAAESNSPEGPQAVMMVAQDIISPHNGTTLPICIACVFGSPYAL